jgi:hypothetical protein
MWRVKKSNYFGELKGKKKRQRGEADLRVSLLIMKSLIN